MKRRQWHWRPRGWDIMITIGHGWGFGFMVLGRNGSDVYVGPVVFSIQAPFPPSWQYMTKEEIADDKSVIGADGTRHPF